MMSSKKLVSIIIVNWNGLKWLDDCLSSIEKQTYSNIEVIFVDNGSIDESIKFVKRNFPKIKVVQNNTNLGFAGGNSIGLEACLGEYIYLLNNDTILEPSCINILASFLDENEKVGSVQSKMLLLKDPDHLDIAGSFWTSTGLLYYFGYKGRSDDPKFNEPIKVFSNKGASMMLKRSAINKVGFFDNDFWCYYEETDLCHRLWLEGYECMYLPSAVMFHAGGGTSLIFDNDYIQFHNFKNKLLSFLKNFQLITLLKFLPIYMVMNIGLSFFWLLTGKPRHFRALYASVWWNIKHLKDTLNKRRLIQAARVISDSELNKTILINPKLKYYLYLLTGKVERYVN